MRDLKLSTLTAAHASQQKPPLSPSLSCIPLHDDVRGREKVLGVYPLHWIARTTASSLPEWQSGNPKELIDRVIQSTPDGITIHTPDTLRTAPSGHISALEVYFLGQLENLPPLRRECPAGALETHNSMLCLRDSIRTKKFLVGVREAVKLLESDKAGEIRVCDAGCGAIPIQAIYAVLCSERVTCTALELNQDSADIARAIVDKLGLAGRIKVIRANAIEYDPVHAFDLVVSETMHSGLTSEPLVQIMSNLSRHVAQGGIMLPSRVSVLAVLGSLDEYTMTERYVRIGDVDNKYLRLNWKAVAQYAPGEDLNVIEARLSTSGLVPGYYFALITSEVEIGTQKLGLYESAITVPQIARKADAEPKFFAIGGGAPSDIVIRYAPGEKLNAKDRIVPW